MAIKTEGRVGASHMLETPSRGTPGVHLSVATVRQLIGLMNASDLSEIVVEQPAQGVRLVLRHTVAPAEELAAGPLPAEPPPSALPAPAPLTITAPLVGAFFPALNPSHKPLVAVGDVVREGQVVAGIESLRVMNEVMAPVAGRITKIAVARGKLVEYGQTLMELEPVDESEIA